MTSRKITAALPDGGKATRRTDRDYQYVVAVVRAGAGQRWKAHTWTTRRNLAEQKVGQLCRGTCARAVRDLADVRIIPIDGTRAALAAADNEADAAQRTQA